MTVVIIDTSDTDIDSDYLQQMEKQFKECGDTVHVFGSSHDISWVCTLRQRSGELVISGDLINTLGSADLVTVHVGPLVHRAEDVPALVRSLQSKVRDGCCLIVVSDGQDHLDKASSAVDYRFKHQVLSSRVERACRTAQARRQAGQTATTAAVLMGELLGSSRLSDARVAPDSAMRVLLPLHVALQAFFGISRSGEDGYVAVDDGREVEWRDGAYHKKGGSPVVGNQNAFLLVPEAEWDFYAEVGTRLDPRADDSSLPADQGEWSLAILVAKLFDTCDDVAKQQGLSADNLRQLAGLRQTAGGFIVDEKEHLKSLCGVLASIESGSELNRKKVVDPSLAAHRTRVLRSQDFLGPYLKKERHTKWPKDLDNDGNQPDDSYKLLAQQLTDWNKNGEPARQVIAGIERLAECLNSAVKLIGDSV